MNPQERERQEIRDNIISGPSDFEATAFRIFHFQYRYNPLYQAFCNHLRRSPRNVHCLTDIPFLPIRFFKTHKVATGKFESALIFRSSGTTESGRSHHHVRDRTWYEQISTSIFERTYGPLDNGLIWALLPSYLEQGDSSLVFMVRSFIEKTQNPGSRFYRYDFEKLKNDIESFLSGSEIIILWGVTYALLDFAEQCMRVDDQALKFPKNMIVMETGGMKGRREEMLRSDVHDILSSAFKRRHIHSEYGMTEMLSQAYSTGDGQFQMSHTLKILAYDVMDPLTYSGEDVSGRCHVVDLANLDSCCFLATEDICRTRGDTFEILGRLDHSEVRGCNLLYQ